MPCGKLPKPRKQSWTRKKGNLRGPTKKVATLQQGLHDTNESMGGVRELRDELEATNANVHKFGEALANTSAQVHKLGETLERKFEPSVQQIKDDLTRTKLDLQQLSEDEVLVKEGLFQEKDNVKQANERIKALVDHLGLTNAKVNNIDKRLGDTTGRSKATLQGLEDLTLENTRFREEHEHTKNQLLEAKESVNRAHQHLKQVHQNLDTVAKGLQHTQKKLDDTHNDTDFSRQNIDDVRSKVRALENGQDRALDVIQQLRIQLAETSAMTDRVKAGLKEHSSLLLPNLNLDSPEARAASQRHGSLLCAGPIVSTQRPSSSRRGRMTPTGAGATNQMAWT
mmetsp:Transcript_137113/g.273484  ORF Transcript_137113/g.273484 Transcript_137113/m.273484 type:complete len:340 (-) Transcript_137113:364-1383(-)